MGILGIFRLCFITFAALKITPLKAFAGRNEALFYVGQMKSRAYLRLLSKETAILTHG